MDRGFFELKFRVIETFYDVHCEENYEYGQAAARTYNEFFQEVKSKSIESIIVVVTVGTRLLKHKEISEYHLNYIKEAINLFDSIDVKVELSDEEYEVLCEEIAELKIELKI